MAKEQKKSVITAKDRKLISVFGSIIIVLALVWFGIRPAITRHFELAAEKQDLKTQVDHVESSQVYLDEIVSQTEQNHQDVAKILQGFNSFTDTAEVDRLITNIAAARNCQVIDLAITEPEGYATLPVYMAAGGAEASGANASDSSASSSSDSSSTGNSESNSGQGGDATATDPNTLTGITEYLTDATFQGSRADLQGIIDDICSQQPGCNINSFEWNQVVSSGSDANWYLNVNLSIYAYDNSTWDPNAQASASTATKG